MRAEVLTKTIINLKIKVDIIYKREVIFVGKFTVYCLCSATSYKLIKLNIVIWNHFRRHCLSLRSFRTIKEDKKIKTDLTYVGLNSAHVRN